MAFLTSYAYPNWKGDLFVGSLKFEYLERLKIKSNKVVKREKILDSIGRVRNVEEGPDGFLYVGVEGKGFLKLYQSHEGNFSFLFLSFSSIAIHLYQQNLEPEYCRWGRNLCRFLFTMPYGQWSGCSG